MDAEKVREAIEKCPRSALITSLIHTEQVALVRVIMAYFRTGGTNYHSDALERYKLILEGRRILIERPGGMNIGHVAFFQIILDEYENFRYHAMDRDGNPAQGFRFVHRALVEDSKLAGVRVPMSFYPVSTRAALPGGVIRNQPRTNRWNLTHSR
jgi:hypothetical protein